MRAAHYDRPVKPRILILGAGFGGLELATTALGGSWRRRRGDADRQERRLRLRLLEARRHVRPNDAGRGPASLSLSREARRTAPARDRHRHRSRRQGRDDRRRGARGRPPRRRPRRRLRRGCHAGAPGSRTSSIPSRAPSASRAPAEFSGGRAVVGVCGAPYKCPPAPSEAALLLHDFLDRSGRPRRLRDLARGAVSDADPAVAEHLRCAASRLRRPRHRLRAGQPGRLARRRPERRRPRRRRGAALRPVPRRAEAPRAGRRDRERA